MIANKIFTVEHNVYFNETNAMGGVAYFSNYVKWQGMVREEWFVKVIPDWRELMKLSVLGQLNMITVEEHSHFIQHAFFGDSILIKLQMSNVKKFSFDMIFLMYNKETDQKIYEGMQRLAFDNFKGKFIPIPSSILRGVQEYEVNIDDLKLLKLKKHVE